MLKFIKPNLLYFSCSFPFSHPKEMCPSNTTPAFSYPEPKSFLPTCGHCKLNVHQAFLLNAWLFAIHRFSIHRFPTDCSKYASSLPCEIQAPLPYRAIQHSQLPINSISLSQDYKASINFPNVEMSLLHFIPHIISWGRTKGILWQLIHSLLLCIISVSALPPEWHNKITSYLVPGLPSTAQ